MEGYYKLSALDFGVNPVFNFGVFVKDEVTVEDAEKILEVISHVLYAAPDLRYKKICDKFNITSNLVPNLLELGLFLTAKIDQSTIQVDLIQPDWFDETELQTYDKILRVAFEDTLKAQLNLHKFCSITLPINIKFNFVRVEHSFSSMFDEAVEKINQINRIIQKL